MGAPQCVKKTRKSAWMDGGEHDGIEFFIQVVATRRPRKFPWAGTKEELDDFMKEYMPNEDSIDPKARLFMRHETIGWHEFADHRSINTLKRIHEIADALQKDERVLFFAVSMTAD